MGMTPKQEFFSKHVPEVKVCENCGFRIDSPGPKNVAHILPKEKFKSVMFEDDAVVYLCSSLDRSDVKGCHDTYDHSWEKAKEMPIWEEVKRKFKLFEDKITERSFILTHFKD